MTKRVNIYSVQTVKLSLFSYMCHFPFSLYSLSREWIYVLPFSVLITVFVKLMNGLRA